MLHYVHQLDASFVNCVVLSSSVQIFNKKQQMFNKKQLPAARNQADESSPKQNKGLKDAKTQNSLLVCHYERLC